MAVDTETEGLGFYDPAFCATVAWRNSDGVQSHYFELSDSAARKYLKAVLGSPILIFHNAKFDLQKLLMAELISRESLSGSTIEDTQTLAYLVNEHWDLHLKPLAKNLLGLETKESAAVAKARRAVKKELGLSSVKEVGYHQLPRPVIYPYALKDAEFTLLLWEKLRPIVAERGLDDLYARERELALVVLDMESRGLAVDLDYCEAEIKRLNGSILEREFRVIDLTGKKVFNPVKQGQKTPEGYINLGSWQQLLAEFKERGVDLDATNKDALSRVSDELAELIIGLRNDKKLRDTYFRGILKEQRNGIIHPWFNIARVRGGRFSSSAAENG